MVSQRTSIAFHESVIDDVKSYHNTVMKGMEINGCAVAPPKKIKLNEHNIAQTQHAAFKAFKESENQNNPFNALKGYYSKYYSIMHDGIMNFTRELNGVFIRLLQSQAEKGLSIVNLP